MIRTCILLVWVLLYVPHVAAHSECTSFTNNCHGCSSVSDACFWCEEASICSNFTSLPTVECKDSGWCTGKSCEFVCQVPCSEGWAPCSNNMVGMIIMMLIYGALLGFGAKLISDGSELLLEILDPGLIGGLVLPVLGAVPDAAIIVVSGAFGSVAEAQEMIQIGMGTLAGSTIMLLTITWCASMFLARCDIKNGISQDLVCTRSVWDGLTTTGVTVDADTPVNAKIMIGTCASYLIGQFVAFGYLADESSPEAKKNEHWWLVAGFIVCAVAFVGYLIYQVYNPALQEKKIAAARRHFVMSHLTDQLFSSIGVSNVVTAAPRARGATVYIPRRRLLDEENGDKTSPLLEGGTPQDEDSPPASWKASAEQLGAAAPINIDIHPAEDEEVGSEGEPDPKKIIPESVALLLLGTALVSMFSDPMVEVLSVFGDRISIPKFYVSFVVTPFCSNASELVSSLIFAAKKKQSNSSLTWSQIYGAATMNNTMCLGIFFALAAFRGLAWTFSAEVLSIIVVTVAVGIISLPRTIRLYWAFVVGIFYPLSLGIVVLLELGFSYVH